MTEETCANCGHEGKDHSSLSKLKRSQGKLGPCFECPCKKFKAQIIVKGVKELKLEHAIPEGTQTLSEKKHFYRKPDDVFQPLYWEEDIKEVIEKIESKAYYDTRLKKWVVDLKEIDKIFGEDLI